MQYFKCTILCGADQSDMLVKVVCVKVVLRYRLTVFWLKPNQHSQI